MKFMLSLLAVGYVVLANPVPSLPVNPGGIGGLFRGPNSETIIKGPDGSVITAAATGGEVSSSLEPIVAAEPAVVAEVAPVAIAPVPVATTGPVIEAVAVPPSAGENTQSSDLIGPSGRIATQGSQSVIAGPASTTITGPAVLAETVVKGPPLIGTPVINSVGATPISSVTAAPIAAVSGPSLVPLSVTPAPLSAVTSADISQISLVPSQLIDTANLASISASAVPIIATGDLSPTIVTSGAPSWISSVTASPPLAIVTPTSSQAVATASVSPHLSVASASSNDGAIASASASSHGASAAVQSVNKISSVTASQVPIVSSTISPLINNGIQNLAGRPGVVGIGNRIDLNSQLIPDQLAVDNRQLLINPSIIPAANIVPPEIAVTPKTVIGRLRPTPGTLLTTPGLGAVASSTNIQRGEADITPSSLQLGLQSGLTEQQILALQNQQALLNDQINRNQQAASSRLANLTPQVIETQTRNNVILNSNGNLRTNGQVTTLDSVQQQDLLNAQLAKSGIDSTQLQLTNIPLSAVSGLPARLDDVVNLQRTAINDGLGTEAWVRYGRDAEKKKKVETTKKSQ